MTDEKDPAPGSLDLAREPGVRSPSSPEIEAWNKQFQTGEFEAFTEEGNDRSEQITGSIRRQQEASAATPAAPGPNKKLTVVVVGVIALVLAVVGFKMLTGRKTKAPEVTQETTDDTWARKMQAAGEDVPDCWETDDGYRFIYSGTDKKRVTVDTIAEVPHLFRKAAICVPD